MFTFRPTATAFAAVATLAACGHQQTAATATPPAPAAAQPVAAPEAAPAAAADSVGTPAPTPAPASHHPESPMTASLDAPKAVPASGTLDIKLSVTRVQPTLAPITLRVELPPGVALAAGQATELVTSTTGTGFDRTFRLSYTAVPSGDAKFIVDWQTDAAGFHAELPYRFGRPEPVAKEPARLPADVVLPGGQNLGRPILTTGGKKKDK